MLPGLGFNELIVLGIITLLVVQPKDLPGLMRTLGRWTRKMQAMAAEFRQGFDELARQTELDELRREVESLRRTANPLSEVHQEVSSLRSEVMRPLDAPPGQSAPPAPETAHTEPVIPENFDPLPPTPPTAAEPEPQGAPAPHQAAAHEAAPHQPASQGARE